MATNTYLVLTDGTTTVTIADGSGGSVSGNYRLVDESWSPAVAGLRRSQLGGVGPYEDVAESMDIAVSGSSVAACFSYISTLTNLINQSEQWYRGDNVSPVLIKYSPRGGTVSSATSPLQAAIIGRAGDSLVTLPPTMDDGNSFKAGVRLSFVRRGLWLHNENSGSAAIANGAVATVPITATTILSPTNILVDNVDNGLAVVYGFAVANSASAIRVISPDTLTATRYTTIASTYGTGGSVLQYAPNSTTETASGITATGIPANCTRIGAMLNIAGSPNGTSYSIRLQYFGDSSVVYPYAYTAPTVYTSSNDAQWISLGQISIKQRPGGVRFQITASASGGSVLLDSLVLFDLSDPGTYQFNTLYNSSTKIDATISNNHNPLAYVSSFVTSVGSAGYYFPATAIGDTSVHTYSGSAYCLLMANDVNATAYGFRQGGSVGTSNTWTVTRKNGYITPA